MSDEPNDLEQQRIRAATKMMAQTTRHVNRSIREAGQQSGHEVEQGIDTIEHELHRRGLPDFVTFAMLAWPMGTLTIACSKLLEAGINKEDIVDVVEIIIESREAGENVGMTVDRFVRRYNIDCECGYAHCPRGYFMLAQACHAVVTTFDSFIGMADLTDEDYDEWEKTKSGRAVKAFECAKACVEFIAIFCINAGMPDMYSV